MTQEQIEKIETELESKGYRKWTNAKSAINSDWEWSKGFHYNDDEKKTDMQIMWRVWNFGIHPSYNDPESQYVLDVFILCYVNHRVDLGIGYPERFGVEKVEEIAEQYYQFCKTNNLI